MTTEELRAALYQALRLAAVGLAFADYALLVDHDRLLASAGWARRSALAVALATRLVPTLERDARDMQLALRGRGVKANPVRLMSPLLAGSLERGLNLAEAMEARGYGARPAHARAAAAVAHLDRAALVALRRADRRGSAVAVAVVDNLRFAYADGHVALDGVSLEIADGEHVVVLGPSGSGKSTLVRALAGLVPHFHGGTFSGRVVVCGLDTREATPGAARRARSPRCSRSPRTRS